ncbi:MULTISPECIES: hypothetical protein [Sphingomonas]|jgi:hypothetical protein|uniref:hypothetical protein n=1 Tax=Sphingomonas TaxID=13687 RepID=UPI000A898067|nr:hypothetical protein [Sphingomonas sanguinis]
MKLYDQSIDHVAATINPAEVSADAAALDASRALTALLESRQQMGLPISTALAAIGKVAQATMMAVNAREELIRAHGMLNRIGADLGIRMEDYGKDVPPQAAVDQAATAATVPA